MAGPASDGTDTKSVAVAAEPVSSLHRRPLWVEKCLSQLAPPGQKRTVGYGTNPWIEPTRNVAAGKMLQLLTNEAYPRQDGEFCTFTPNLF